MTRADIPSAEIRGILRKITHRDWTAMILQHLQEDDNDNDTLKKGQPTSGRQPGTTDMSDGVTSTGKKRNLFQLLCLALVARCATGTL